MYLATESSPLSRDMVDRAANTEITALVIAQRFCRRAFPFASSIRYHSHHQISLASCNITLLLLFGRSQSRIVYSSTAEFLIWMGWSKSPGSETPDGSVFDRSGIHVSSLIT